MADLSEVWSKLCETIAGDATIAGLLGGTGSVLYAEDVVDKLPDYPFIRLMIVNADPSRVDSGVGRWDVMLQIDVFGPQMAVNWRLHDLMQGLLEIPRTRPNGLSTANYEIKEMTIAGPISPVGRIGIKDSQGRDIKQLSATWMLRVVKVGG
jgi:hypothetical protein